MTIAEQNQKFVAALMRRIRAKADAEAEKAAVLRERIKLLSALAGVDDEDADLEEYEADISKVEGSFQRALLAARAKRPRATQRERQAAIMRG